MEIEAEAFLAEMRDLKLPDGRDRLVWHGRGPERIIQTGIGAVHVSRVKVRDRGANDEAERIRFSKDGQECKIFEPVLDGRPDSLTPRNDGKLTTSRQGPTSAFARATCGTACKVLG
ncbi:hypothetical protein [Mesorhizobium sp. L2C066B000]|uniref:hypothetical protein n=1 Tax=Mesorhizobium sp. L2C066B000 TaxID=1287105 RepID=UPI0004CFD10D|nr:hypothetical protein [Mesorhizobium sp. L2C066B000]